MRLQRRDDPGGEPQAEFEIASDGVVRRNPKGSPNTVGFFSESEASLKDATAIVVRLEAISSVDPALKSWVMCGSLAPKTQFLALPPDWLTDDKDVWRLTVYLPHGPDGAVEVLNLDKPKGLTDARLTTVLTKAKANEKALIYGRVGQLTVSATILAATYDTLVHLEVSSSVGFTAGEVVMAPAEGGGVWVVDHAPDGTHLDLRGAAFTHDYKNDSGVVAGVALQSSISTIETYLARGRSSPTPAQLDGLKDAARNVVNVTNTDIIAGKIALYGAALKAIGDSYPVAKDALTSLQTDLRALNQKARVVLAEASASTPSPERVAWVVEDLKSVWTDVLNKGKPDGAADCQAAWETNFHDAPDLVHYWELGVFELPSTPVGRTLVLPSTGTAAPARNIPVDGKLTAWATYVKTPMSSPVTFLWDPGSSTAPNGLQAVAAFLSVLATKAPLLAAGVKVPPFSAGGASNPYTRWFAMLTSTGDCSGKNLDVPYPLAPLATYETVARTSKVASGGLLRDRNYTVYACTGPCVVSGPGKTSFVQVRAQTPAGWGLTLLGAITYDFRLNREYRFTEFDWRPATPAGATQQVFVLDEVPQPLQSVSSSLLLTLLFPQSDNWRVGLGLGPTIVYGTGAGALQQWTLNLLVQPPFLHSLTDKVYFTVGGGFRMFNRPLLYPDGSTIVLPLTNGVAPAAPSVGATRVDVAPVLQLGIALDLSVLGDAASAVFGTKISPPAGGATGAP